MKSNNIKLTTLIVTCVSLGIRVISFFRDILLASHFGATAMNDVFIASQSIVATFAGFLMQSLSSAYLPYASDYYCGDRKGKRIFWGNIYTHAAILGVLQVLLCYFAMDWLIELLTPGFDIASRQILVVTLMIQLPVLFTQMLNGITDANLQVANRYAYTELSTGLPYLFSVGYLLIAGVPTIYGLAVSIMLGNVLMFLVKVPFLSRHFRPVFFKRGSGADWKGLYITAGLALATTAVRQVNSLVGQAISSLLGAGNVTMLSYAMKIPVTETALISTVLSTVIFANIARNISSHQEEKNEGVLNDALSFVLTLVVPMMVLTVLFRVDIIEVLFQRGAFTAENTAETAALMAVYSSSMVALAIQDVVVRTMFAYKNRKYSVITSIILAAVNIMIDLLTYKILGNIGIALAYSVSVWVIIPILMYYCNRKIVPIRWKEIAGVSGKAAGAAVVAAVLAWLCKYALAAWGLGTFPVLVCACIVYVMVYLGSGLLLKNDTIVDLVKSLKAMLH